MVLILVNTCYLVQVRHFCKYLDILFGLLFTTVQWSTSNLCIFYKWGNRLTQVILHDVSWWDKTHNLFLSSVRLCTTPSSSTDKLHILAWVVRYSRVIGNHHISGLQSWACNCCLHGAIPTTAHWWGAWPLTLAIYTQP